MRYPAAEKLEIMQQVEQSPLPVRLTLAKLGIPRATSNHLQIGEIGLSHWLGEVVLSAEGRSLQQAVYRSL